MAWNCEQTEDRLLDALDGTLSAAERGQMDEHTVGCARCVALVASVRQTVESLARLEAVEPAPWLVPKIIERTSGRRPEKRRRLAWMDFLTQPRFAMGIATVAVTIVILAHAAGPQLSQLTPADLNPVNLVRAGNRQAHLTYARGEKFVNDLRVVYEIESRFASSPAMGDQPEPVPAVQPRPGQEPPSPDPNTGDKSQGFPRPDRREVRRGSELAVLMITSLSDHTPRSLL